MGRTDLTFDAHGLPTGELGALAWQELFTVLNRQADEAGWDRQAQLYGLGGPVGAALELMSSGVTLEQLADESGFTGADGVATGYMLEFLAAVPGNPVEALWCVDVPDEFSAVVLTSEAWTGPSVVMLDGRRPEARLWILATRSGEVHAATFDRDGDRSVRRDVPSSTVVGMAGRRAVSLLARTVGAIVSPAHPPAGPLSLPEHLGCMLAVIVSNVAVDVLSDREMVAMMAGPDEPMAVSPFGWSGRWVEADGRKAVAVITLGVMISSRIAQMATSEGNDRVPEAQFESFRSFAASGWDGAGSAAARIDTSREATSGLTWTDLAVRGTGAGLLPPQTLPPATAALWAGEQLLATWAAAASRFGPGDARAALENLDEEHGVGFVVEDLAGMLGWSIPRGPAAGSAAGPAD